jgi:hypothetical protein
MKDVARALLVLLLTILVACPQNPALPTNSSNFNIELRYLPSFPDQYKPLVEAQAHYWETVIVGDISDTTGSYDPVACRFTNEQSPIPLPILTEVDDLVLYVGSLPKVESGVGGTVAAGGPCLVRNEGSKYLPVIAKIEFDLLDLPGASATADQLSLFNDVAIHELGHALGFGTIWDQFPGLYIKTKDATSCGDNPQFTGLNAVREYQALGGIGNVPLTASNDEGSCGHWAESLFVREIMTSATQSTQASVGRNNPLSRLTIASMEDLGYVVDYNLADAYSLPVPDVNPYFDVQWTFSKDFPQIYRPYFQKAANRWAEIITGDVPNMAGIFDPANNNCKVSHQSKFSGIEDIKIFIELIPAAQSDGVGGFTKRIEPCLTRDGSFLPAIAVMQYDSSDLSSLYGDTTTAPFNVIRDMARVLGFGTNWLKKGLIGGVQSLNQCSPGMEYTGSHALAQYYALGGTVGIVYRSQAYPIPTTPTTQTCAEYWPDTNVFNQELMSGNNLSPGDFINPSAPARVLTKVTVGAMEDLGYTVDYSAANIINKIPPVYPGCDPSNPLAYCCQINFPCL